MGSKIVNETLSGYFDELLGGEPDRSDMVEEAPADTKEQNLGSDSPVKDGPLKEGAAKDTQNSNNESSQEQPIPKPVPVPESALKATATIKPPVDASIKASRDPASESKRDDTPKPANAITETDSKTPAPALKTSAAEKPESPADSAYEQHKQRLERMLQQVSAVQSQTLTQTSAKAGIETETEVKAEVEAKVETRVASPTDIQADTQTDAATVTAEAYADLPPLTSEWLENGRPQWAQERFDILLIEVNGLQLALPLIALGHIEELQSDSMTPLFGQSDWFMGLQKTNMGNVKTVDTAKFVMPERYQEQNDYGFVVSINGSGWGLAVDRIHQPISINPDAIRWRAKRSSRPWMAGTVKDHMCVLLDVPAMTETLQQQDKNHPQ